MARSPSHQFGQIIGGFLEGIIKPILQGMAEKHNLYLDSKGARQARKGTQKVSWYDLFGNKHDLDFVFERGGTDSDAGEPLAFIEVAWRRYTRHSRNKVQEIEGAILPLAMTHKRTSPFMGAILAGEFTPSSLLQLRSRGFSVLYIPQTIVVEAFRTAGLEALYDENTPDSEFAKRIGVWAALDHQQRASIARTLMSSIASQLDDFLKVLDVHLSRQIIRVSVLVLHGKTHTFDQLADAIGFLTERDEADASHPVVRYEIQIRYNNDIAIDGQFPDKMSAIGFLRTYEPSPLRIATR